MSGGFDLLLGGRIYEIFAAYWPYAGDNYHREGLQQDRFDWVNSQPIGADAVDENPPAEGIGWAGVACLRRQRMLQTLITAELVDEFRV